MNNQEFGVIVKTLRSAYSNNPSFLEDAVEVKLWLAKLSDIPYETARSATDMFISGASEFPPSLPQFLNKCREVILPDLPTPSEAWEMAVTAATRYGTTHWEKARESLPEPVRSVARGEMFREICLSENQIATRSHFMTRYKDYIASLRSPASGQNMVIEGQEVKQISGEVAVEEEQNTVPELKNGVSSERIRELKMKFGLI